MKLYTYENHVMGESGFYSVSANSREEASQKIGAKLCDILSEISNKQFDVTKYIKELIRHIKEDNGVIIRILYDDDMFIKTKLFEIEKMTEMHEIVNMTMKEYEIGEVVFFQENVEY